MATPNRLPGPPLAYTLTLQGLLEEQPGVVRVTNGVIVVVQWRLPLRATLHIDAAAG